MRMSWNRLASFTAAAVVAVTVTTGCALFRPFATETFGAARTEAQLLPWGNLEVPGDERAEAVPAGDQIGVVGDLIREWAEEELPDWQEEGKVSAPRVLLAKLAVGININEVNSYIQATTPWAGIGSTWGLRPNGDYDFSLPPLTAILYLYGDDSSVLYPETREHLLSVLLNQEGSGFTTTVPGSAGLVTETENHILMIEGSRYLKNQWLRTHGDDRRRYDNTANGLEEELAAFIQEMEQAGPYEFNSTPYAGYTAMALLTLEAFAEEPVASAARSVLDRMNYEYALGSHGLRRYGVYRRQPKRAGETSLTKHPQTAMMHVWVAQTLGADYPGAAEAIAENRHHAVFAALMPYRLPTAIAERAARTDRDHTVRIGRGPDASPELYSAGPGVLLSAGGTGRPEGSLIVARPITLFLNDGAGDLTELFTIGGEGDYHEWNNTGVLADFAVGRSPLTVPEAYQTIASSDSWRVYAGPPAGTGVDGSAGGAYSASRRVLIAGADTGSVAALYVHPLDAGTDAAAAAQTLARDLEAGVAPSALDGGSVTLPDGRTVTFDLAADADDWVITAVDGAAVDLDLTGWPRLTGEIR